MKIFTGWGTVEDDRLFSIIDRRRIRSMELVAMRRESLEMWIQ